MPKTVKKKAAKKKPTRRSTKRPLPVKPSNTTGCHPTDAVKLRALTVYHITGSIKTAAKDVGYTDKTIYEWLKDSKIVDAAKEIANKYLDIKCSEIVELSHQGIIEKIDTKEKRKEVSAEALNRMFGTAADKLMAIRGLNKSTVKHEGEMEIKHYLMTQYILIKEQAKKESIDDSKNRIKEHLG